MLSMKVIILMKVMIVIFLIESMVVEITSLPSLPTTASKEQMARPPKISETLISIIIDYNADTSLQIKTEKKTMFTMFSYISIVYQF